MLSDKGLIEFNKNSIILGKNHAKVWSKIGAEEARVVKDFTSEIKSNGALDWLDSDEAEKIIESKSSKARK